MAVHGKTSDDDSGRAGHREGSGDLNPIFARAGEVTGAPRVEIPPDGMQPDTAYQLIHDELMLDGNARLNLATFVTTWMEPQAEKLMVETFDKNMVDKDEYPRTADIEMRCVNMLSRLWHSPDRRGGHRHLDHRLERSRHARRHGAQVAVARSDAGAGQADRQAQPGRRDQRPGVLGEVLPLLGRRDAPGARWRESGSP